MWKCFTAGKQSFYSPVFSLSRSNQPSQTFYQLHYLDAGIFHCSTPRFPCIVSCYWSALSSAHRNLGKSRVLAFLRHWSYSWFKSSNGNGKDAQGSTSGFRRIQKCEPLWKFGSMPSLFRPLKDYHLINIAYQQVICNCIIMISTCIHEGYSFPQWDRLQSTFFSSELGMQKAPSHIAAPLLLNVSCCNLHYCKVFVKHTSPIWEIFTCMMCSWKWPHTAERCSSVAFCVLQSEGFEAQKAVL